MDLVFSLAILVFSTILHELAHGFVADKLGDPTPRLSGRLTLNPRPHIDPYMSILLPLLLFMSGSPVIFGAAKPVPVDPFNLKEGRKDVALVSLSGPLTNFLLALFASFCIKFFTLGIVSFNPVLSLLSLFFYKVLEINLFLGIFNLLPIPPLDGSKIFALLLPERESALYLSFGSIGMFILFFLLAFPIGGFSLGGFVYNLFLFAQNLLLK